MPPTCPMINLKTKYLFFHFYLIFMDLIHFKSIIIQINLKKLIKWYLVVWIAFMKHLLAAKFVQAIFVHKIMVVGPRKECSSMVVKQNPKHNGTSLRLLMWLNSHWYIHMQASHIAFTTWTSLRRPNQIPKIPKKFENWNLSKKCEI